ncbi:hypothetical protein CCB81_12530 [Armatimonadetes bacterium Uphvl-Ar2]|nr:hypothetical protein CCB81_12530 [Armatimonadetes bacterium Uphvl-Ar2]
MSITPFSFEHIRDYIGCAFKEQGLNKFLHIYQQAEVEPVERTDQWQESFLVVRVALPPRTHRQVSSDKSCFKFEETVTKLANQATAGSPHFRSTEITSLPISDDSWRGGIARPINASMDETTRLWGEGCFRLFLSHSSSDKSFATRLKDALSPVNINVFVAHEDIEPNLEWQNEIKLALSSCHALLYLASPKANTSVWCQQEVGWALGRGVFVTSYKLKYDPVGFASPLQGWKSARHDLPTVRRELLTMLAKEDRTEPALRIPLVQVLLDADTAGKAIYALEFLNYVKALDKDILKRLQMATFPPKLSEHEEIMQDISELLSKHGVVREERRTTDDDSDPFSDDFDPFESD